MVESGGRLGPHGLALIKELAELVAQHRDHRLIDQNKQYVFEKWLRKLSVNLQHHTAQAKIKACALAFEAHTSSSSGGVSHQALAAQSHAAPSTPSVCAPTSPVPSPTEGGHVSQPPSPAVSSAPSFERLKHDEQEGHSTEQSVVQNVETDSAALISEFIHQAHVAVLQKTQQHACVSPDTTTPASQHTCWEAASYVIINAPCSHAVSPASAASMHVAAPGSPAHKAFGARKPRSTPPRKASRRAIDTLIVQDSSEPACHTHVAVSPLQVPRSCPPSPARQRPPPPTPPPLPCRSCKQALRDQESAHHPTTSRRSQKSKFKNKTARSSRYAGPLSPPANAGKGIVHALNPGRSLQSVSEWRPTEPPPPKRRRRSHSC